MWKINLDDIQGPGTHWVCYRNLDSVVEYFDPFGLIMPSLALKYFNTSGKQIVYSIDEIQNRNTVFCGYWCLYYLIERQNGKNILDVIHNPHFDNDNSDFIKRILWWVRPQLKNKYKFYIYSESTGASFSFLTFSTFSFNS